LPTSTVGGAAAEVAVVAVAVPVGGEGAFFSREQPAITLAATSRNRIFRITGRISTHSPSPGFVGCICRASLTRLK
jgi:hypothetical protein